jgi:hypothetical protein
LIPSSFYVSRFLSSFPSVFVSLSLTFLRSLSTFFEYSLLPSFHVSTRPEAPSSIYKSR